MVLHVGVQLGQVVTRQPILNDRAVAVGACLSTYMIINFNIYYYLRLDY